MEQWHEVPSISTVNILLRATATIHFRPDLLEKVRAVEGAALEKAAGYLEGAPNIPSRWDP